MLSFNYIQKGKKENHVPPLNAPTLCILKRDRASDILPLPYVDRMKKNPAVHFRFVQSLCSHDYRTVERPKCLLTSAEHGSFTAL